jgi:hypothetical protein
LLFLECGKDEVAAASSSALVMDIPAVALAVKKFIDRLTAP